MKRANCLTRLILTTGLSMFAGCERHHEAAQSNSSATNPAKVAADRVTYQSDNWQSQTNTDPWAEAMRNADKIYQEKLRNPSTNKEVPLPNYQAGPLNPRPIHVNFYESRDYYQAYLLCSYDVDENNYDQSKEAWWFKASLEQTRQLGPEKFPPIKWVAVAIHNRAEQKGVSTFEQSFKVGAIFKASDVFDSSCDLSQLTARADMNRHPFKYDPQQPTPGEQQRWLVVEQHATNNPTTGSK